MKRPLSLRERKLAQALRDNLLKRKQQQHKKTEDANALKRVLPQKTSE